MHSVAAGPASSKHAEGLDNRRSCARCIPSPCELLSTQYTRCEHAPHWLRCSAWESPPQSSCRGAPGPMLASARVCFRLPRCLLLRAPAPLRCCRCRAPSLCLSQTLIKPSTRNGPFPRGGREPQGVQIRWVRCPTVTQPPQHWSGVFLGSLRVPSLAHASVVHSASALCATCTSQHHFLSQSYRRHSCTYASDAVSRDPVTIDPTVA